MTAIIGFVTDGQIIVAGDSQVTTGDLKETDATKVFELKFKSGESALIARAGVIDGASIFQEIVERKAAETEVTQQRTIADTVESALKEAKNKILDGVRHPILSSLDCIAHLESLRHETLLAYYYDGKPYLYKGEAIGAYVIPVQKHYLTLGSGSNIATFVLDGVDTRSLSEEFGIGMAAHTIALCKRSATGVDGKTQIAILTPDGAVLAAPDSLVKETESAANVIYNEMRRSVVSRIQIELSKRNVWKIGAIRRYLAAQEERQEERPTKQSPRRSRSRKSR